MAHKDDGLIVLLSLPEKQQIAVDLGLFQLFVDQGEQGFQHLMEGKELFPLEIVGAGDRLAPEHFGQFLGVTIGPGIRLGLIGGHLFGHQQGADDGNRQQHHNQGHKGQKGIQNVSHLARPF